MTVKATPHCSNIPTGRGLLHPMNEMGFSRLLTTTGWCKKAAQSLWHHNFATVHHRVMRFSAKCSNRNSLYDL